MTQSNIVEKSRVDTHTLEARDHSFSCVTVSAIHVRLILSPTVWVANEFTPGSCMYNVVRDHEMKHVNKDRIVADRQVGRFRAALAEVSRNRGYFGPGSPPSVMASVQQLEEQIRQTINLQMEDFKAEQSRAQQEVDTAAEYSRIAHACPGQGG